LLLRKVWGYCKPRSSEAAAALFLAFSALLTAAATLVNCLFRPTVGYGLDQYSVLLVTLLASATATFILSVRKNRLFLTGC
jgi:hypothetical protein